MGLEFLGQYWNPETHRVHLLGKGEGAVHDLTPHLPYASTRDRLLAAHRDDPALPLLLEAAPFPTVQAVLEAERAGRSLPALLAPAWEAARRGAEHLDESALAVQPDPFHAHQVACVLPLRAQAFGVTYENSALEREAEGHKEDYQYVYKSLKYRQERCEVFLKGTRLAHFFGPHGIMGLRSDLTNSVGPRGEPKPRERVLAGIEPELACVTYSDGRILGYTLANDVSGNLIENESILYLYQAKYFAASTGIGPWLWLSDEQDNPGIRFSVCIWDAHGREVFRAEADSSLIGLPIHALVRQAASHNALYPGELFLTGTNIVPGDEAKVLQPDWRVEIRAERLGSFTHGAELVSAADPKNLDYHALEARAPAPRAKVAAKAVRKTARKAVRKVAARGAVKGAAKTVRKTVRKAVGKKSAKGARKAVRKVAPKRAAKAAVRKAAKPARKTVRKAVRKVAGKSVAKKAVAKKVVAKGATRGAARKGAARSTAKRTAKRGRND
jgi:hypothetical protein